MTGIVNLGASLPLTTGGKASRRSPELDAQLNTSRAQLADWVTCDSAKTPEGKAKIAQISAKVDALKKQIVDAGRADKPQDTRDVRTPQAAPAGQGVPSRQPSGTASSAALAAYGANPGFGINRPTTDPDATLGRRLDLFA